MSYSELIEWRTYFDETEFGELRADRRNAELLSMLYNINRSPRQPARTSDFYMPVRRQKDLTDEQLHDKMEAFFRRLE